MNGRRPRLRVLVVEDSPVARRLMVHILNEDPDLEVVAEAADGRDAVETARRHRPDVVLLDVRMPMMDGLAAAEELRRAVPSTAVLLALPGPAEASSA